MVHDYLTMNVTFSHVAVLTATATASTLKMGSTRSALERAE